MPASRDARPHAQGQVPAFLTGISLRHEGGVVLDVVTIPVSDCGLGDGKFWPYGLDGAETCVCVPCTLLGYTIGYGIWGLPKLGVPVWGLL